MPINSYLNGRTMLDCVILPKCPETTSKVSKGTVLGQRISNEFWDGSGMTSEELGATIRETVVGAGTKAY